MHCDKRVPDYRGNCISVCGPCVAAGVNPRDYKAKRAEKTCLEAYGVRNVFQTDWAKQKMAVTNKLRYGAPNPASAESALRADMNAYLKTSGKKREQSRRKTMSTKYGAEHWTRVPELVDRFQSNLEDKHGSEVTNVMHIPEVRALHTKRMSELTEQGFWKGIYDTKVREVLIEKYGAVTPRGLSIHCKILEHAPNSRKLKWNGVGYVTTCTTPKSSRRQCGIDASMYMRCYSRSVPFTWLELMKYLSYVVCYLSISRKISTQVSKLIL
jgi:hypothetical protein